MKYRAGDRIGAYEIVELLGAGGMGEVYRAHDTRLDRDVALKILGPALAGDVAHLARFTREAKALAALQHPNIGAIHGLESGDGGPYLVLELVEGEPLSSRLPLAPREAALAGAQLADALAAAHARGLVHRDLKPDNVRFDGSGRIKLLDFGLARAVALAGREAEATASIGPTLAGTILGTPAYMSPEQARGQAVDECTDVWSLGCVLFEMLCGGRAFEAPSLVDTLAQVVTAEPDWSRLPDTTPARFVELLQRCLRKERTAREGSAAAVRDELLAMAHDAGGEVRTSLAPAQLVQFTFEEGIEEHPAWSPDGAHLVYVAAAGAVRHLVRRALEGGGDAVPLTSGDRDDILPAWSKDGATIYFVRARTAGRRLEPGDVFGLYLEADVWELDVASGSARLLVEHAFNPAPSPDGTLLAVDASWAGPRRIWLVDRNGRNPQQASTDASEAVAHLRPRWSPDGKRIAFQVLERTNFSLGMVEPGARHTGRLDAGAFQNYQPAFTPRGDALVFASYRSGGMNLWSVPLDRTGAAAGPARQLTHGAGRDAEPAPSPDGVRLAFTILRQNASLWRLPVDPATGRVTGPPEKVVASTREDSRGAWSPDGTRIAFNSDRDGNMNLWLRETDGRLVQLTRGPGGDYQPNWSPDGRRLVFFSSRSGHPGIWELELDGRALRPLSPAARGLRAGIEINPFHSPDGRRIAYQSDEDGRLEVWIMDADGRESRQLTRIGVSGHFLRWAPDGRSLVFNFAGSMLAPPRVMRVAAEGGEPEALPRVMGGAHLSFSPGAARIMDVVGHKTLWLSPLDGSGEPEAVYEFPDPEVRIDYPVWSPDGRYVLFDRFQPRGGDIWIGM